MANDNNNNKTTASQVDEDPTAEFEIPANLLNHPRAYSPEIEVDEDTYDFEGDDAEERHLSGAALKQKLRMRQQRIDDLEFELEQLRAKHRGATEELSAREDIAITLGSAAEAARQLQAEAEAELNKVREELDALKSASERASESRSTLNDENQVLKASAVESERQIESLKEQLNAQDLKISQLQSDLSAGSRKSAQQPDTDEHAQSEIERLRSDLHKARDQVTELQAQIDSHLTQWRERENQISQSVQHASGADSAAEDLDSEVASHAAGDDDLRQQLASSLKQLQAEKSRGDELQLENRKLAQKIDDLAGRELEQDPKYIATQAGEIAALSRESEELRKDNARIEEYADALRIQLQDQIAIAKISVAMRRKLEIGLDRADRRIEELTTALEDARAAEVNFRERLAVLETKHADEMRQLRFELGAAQETISDQETLNQQLASELVDQHDFKQALESQLEQSERKNRKSVQTLTEDVERTRREVEELERSIQTKDRAIADLMKELAERSDEIEVKAESSSTLQRIDGFGSRQSRAARGEKTTRQLIGSADGRELRFPLFKDRLTIGRTSNNDIQLKMQFVSRRHAVIATDHGTTRVIDWGSKNGVYVNRERVTERILNSGDIVTIGTTDFRYDEHNKN
jgi:chromosome segregation ATPase